MQNLAEGAVHIGLQIADRPGLFEYRGYLGHCILSAPLMRAVSEISVT
jgi:hypothetical protein